MRVSKRGMTLIEVLISFAILLAGMMGILAVMTTGLRAHRRAVNETVATQVVASVLAETRATFSHGEKLSTDSPKAFNPSSEFPDYEYNRRIICLDPASSAGFSAGMGNREYLVRVEVRWKEGGDYQSISVTTIVCRNRY